MSKIFFCSALIVAIAFPFAALADTTLTLPANTTLNLDTGATVTTGGDIHWDGSNITLAGSATAADLVSYGLTGTSGYAEVTPTSIAIVVGQGGGSILSASPISPLANDVIVVLTNGGNYSKILVTAISGTSLSLEFDTFMGSSTGPTGGPTISSLQNNYSYIPPGLPSYGIAPGALFLIFGTDLSDPVTPVLQSLTAPLPLTLNHTSIAVTVNGVTTNPALYYTSAKQLAAVLPSSTPVGPGTLVVTYNGTNSAPANILVTKSAFGIDTLYGTGSGGIVATVGSSVIVPTASASPGQTITIWGSGLGADTANDDRTFPLKQDNLNDATVYIGGVKANVTYAGRSQYPGVDQVNAVVPAVSGCGLSVVVVANGLSSNFGTLPVNAGGGVCSDPTFGITGSQIGQFGNLTTLRSGNLSLTEFTLPSLISDSAGLKPAAATTTSFSATASFSSETGVAYVSGTSFFSLGGCIVSQTATSSTSGQVTSTGLDAGTPITLTGGGLSVPLPEAATSGTGVGSYRAALSSPLAGGTAYTFTGPGGKDVGPFTATVTFPVPLTWTNQSADATITESLGVAITWTGGASGTYVVISGSSSALAGAAASFLCLAPVSDQQFTVPSYVLQALPTGTGGLGLSNYSSRGTFTATGIDYGTITAGVSIDQATTYQ